MRESKLCVAIVWWWLERVGLATIKCVKSLWSYDVSVKNNFWIHFWLQKLKNNLFNYWYPPKKVPFPSDKLVQIYSSTNYFRRIAYILCVNYKDLSCLVTRQENLYLLNTLRSHIVMGTEIRTKQCRETMFYLSYKLYALKLMRNSIISSLNKYKKICFFIIFTKNCRVDPGFAYRLGGSGCGGYIYDQLMGKLHTCAHSQNNVWLHIYIGILGWHG